MHAMATEHCVCLTREQWAFFIDKRGERHARITHKEMNFDVW